MHMSNDDRDLFLAACEQFSRSRGSRAARKELSRLAGQFCLCTDTMPRGACDEISIELGSTFAEAAQAVREGRIG